MDGNRRIGAASFRFLALNTVNQATAGGGGGNAAEMPYILAFCRDSSRRSRAWRSSADKIVLVALLRFAPVPMDTKQESLDTAPAQRR